MNIKMGHIKTLSTRADFQKLQYNKVLNKGGIKNFFN